MTVYIEYVILDNLVINSLLVSLVGSTLRRKISKYRILLASVVGTLFAIFLPFVTVSNTILFLIKLIVGLLVVLCFANITIRDVSISYMLFVSYTFLMGGMCYFVLDMCGIPTTASGVLIYSFDIPVSILILMIYVYYIVIKKFISYKRNVINLNYQVKLSRENKSISLVGFLDTGNQIFDENGRPIVVISLKSFLKYYPHISILKVATNSVSKEDLRGSKYISIMTAASTSKMLVFSADKLTVYDNGNSKEFENVTVGVSSSNFHSKFDCILHGDYI